VRFRQTLEPLPKDGPFWTSFLERLAFTAPRRGRLVRIMRGREKGLIGRVVWHGKDGSDRFYTFGAADHWQLEAAGRKGYRIGVSKDGAPPIFTKAEYALVCVEESARD